MDISRREIMPLVTLTSVRTDKFKTSCLGVSFCLQLSRKDASKNAVLPKVLLRGSASYPDMESMSAAMDELYGTKIVPLVRNKGEVQCTGLFADFVDDAYVPGNEKLLEKVVALVGEILLCPATRAGLLNSDYVSGEKEKHADQIKSMISDKQKYANMRLKELMCADEAFAVDSLGSAEDTMKITPASLTKHYRKTLENAKIEIFYCGSADISRVEGAVKDAFEALPRLEKESEPIGTDVKTEVGKERNFTESLDITQGKLAIGFRLGKIMLSPDLAAILVFNAIYGGSVTSKLFSNVREKLSLCYYASSRIERYKGIMFVSSGIEFEKYDEALAEILNQLEQCRQGNITAEEFENAKKSVVNELRSMMDSPRLLEDFYLGQALESLDYSPEILAALALEIKPEQAVAVAQSVKLDSVYFLKNNERSA